MGIIRAKSAVAAMALLCASPGVAWALDLHRERGSPFDLAVTGRVAGVPAGETRYVPWAELRALPVVRLRLQDEFTPGEQEVTVLYLDELWRVLPAGPGADLLLASCNDGYASVYRRSFIARYRPFLVLEIDGHGPADWPPPGLKFNPGPYVITVSAALVPGVATLLDVNHKKPWGVVTLEFANYGERFHDAYAGAWAHLSARAAAGREIWVNSCASCHAGPGRIFGGTKSGEPFPVLAGLAAANPGFFRAYVRHPQALVPSAKMEGHPRYTDPQLDQLIAFVTAESP
jgi:cytochrome c553